MNKSTPVHAETSAAAPAFTQYVIANCTHDDNAALAAASSRIGSLLRNPRILAMPEATACLDDLLGVVQGLFLARAHSFDDRLGKPIEIAVLQRRADDLEHGRVRTDGKWMAGFFFNSALFRLSAVCHRVLKVVLDARDSRDYVHDLRRRVEEKYTTWRMTEWVSVQVFKVHDEVNMLKHTAEGIYVTRSISYADAIAALNEILDLFEAWTAQLD